MRSRIVIAVLAFMAFMAAVSLWAQERPSIATSPPRRQSDAPEAAAAGALPKPRAKSFVRPFDELPVATHPEPAFEVQLLPGTDGEAIRDDQAFAARMSRITAVPETRVQAFRWFAGQSEYSVTGWHGYIQEIREVPGARIVTLRITPRVKSTGGGFVSVRSDLLERWSVSGAGVEFLDSIGGPGGEEPVMIQL